MSYARYKFNKAVQSLKEAGEKRREWLVGDDLSRLMRLTPADIPLELMQEFQLLQREMAPLVRARKMELPCHAIQATDEQTAARIIERIMHMHALIESKDE